MAENAFLWSPTASDNDDADAAVPWPEGMLPGAVNNGARGIMAAVARLIKDLNGTISTTGSANAYLLTASSGHTALTNGILVSAKASFANTGAATLNLNSFGAKKIRVFTDGAEADVTAGQIVSGATYQFRYDTALDSASGAFLLLNPAVSGNSVGTIKIWPSDTLETGWAWCNGQELSQTTYATLYTIVGTTYNTGGETSGFFRVPDLCGRAPFGSDDMGGISAKNRITNAGSSIVGTTLGASGGAQSVTLSTSQIPSHTHTGTTGIESAGHTHSVSGTTATESATHTHAVSITSGDNSADHSHAVSITSGNNSADHTHAVSGTSSGVSANHTHSGTTGTESADHSHNVTLQTNNILYAAGATNLGVFGSGSGTTFATGGRSATHTHTVTTGTESADHTHTFSTTSGGVSANHTHAVSGNTGGVSANHTHAVSGDTATESAAHAHTFSVTSGGVSANHTHAFTSDATGGGALHTNMPPALIVNYAIRAA